MIRRLYLCLVAWVKLIFVVWGIVGYAWAEVPEFARLPYRTRPLVQAGSGNVLPSPGFAAGLQGWETKGDVTLITVDNEPCLRFGARKGDERAHIRVYVPKPKGGVLYRLRFEVKMTPNVEFDWDSTAPGLNGWLSHAVKGKIPIGPVAIRETRRSEQWLPLEYRLFSHPNTNALYILLGFNATRGEALTRRWELVEERIEASENRVILETPSGEWAEEPHKPQPAPPANPVLWAPKDPDNLCRNMLPGSEDSRSPLELRGTPGEMCVGAVCLYTPRAVTKVKLTFTPLDGLGVTPGAKLVVFHPRRTDYYGRGMTFRYVPDFFVERPEGVQCAAGETSAFWVNLRLPKEAKPGVYRGKVSVEGMGAELALPVEVQVYPFQLSDLPDKVRHLYLDSFRWERMSDEQVLAELADVKDHGYESIDLGARGSVEIVRGKVVSFALSERSVRNIRLALQARLKGPFLFWAGWLPGELAQKLALPREVMSQSADKWPPELGVAMTEALRLMKREIQRLGIADPVLVLVDEPGYWKKGSPERMAWDARTGHDAGWPVYCTSSYLPSDPVGQNLDYHCYGGGQLTTDPVRAAFVAEHTRKAGQKLWYYCTGAYSGQIGNMLHNRYLAGFFFYRCGADGTASWTFQRPRGNAFDDFLIDQKTGAPLCGQPCITYPDPEHPGQNLDTPTWEGLRQAWYDHRYAETLRQAIESARKKNPQRAKQAEERLHELIAALPWNGNPFLWPQMTNEKMTQTRAAIAEEIINLMQ